VADAGITYIPWRKDLYDETMRNQNELFGKNVVWVQAFERLAQEDQYSQVLVAVDSTGRQVGWTLMLEPDIGLQKDLAFPALLGEKTGQIACVGVHPDARNKGVGLALVATAALNLKSRGMERVFIDWVVLVGWYEKAGFEVWRQYRPMKLAGIA
jgi:beta-N-acetylhexosaminidase